jgi:oxygen-independent coproporphyrinogen III oxidase
MSPQTFSGLYIHIPFCLTKCPYCDFYSCADLHFVHDFTAAFEKELLFYCKSFPSVDTVYLGGGTPTAMPDAALSGIMATVRKQIAIFPEAEITIEANPNDLSSERLAHLRSLGFNRLSIGVQSFDDAMLQFLGRRHTADEARRSIDFAREAGFDTISIDLMYALPGQSREGWTATLDEALRYTPEHLSCYQLTIKEGTPFFDCAQMAAFQPCDEQDEAELFMATSVFLEERGYGHYEVSNFARAEKFQARHNSKYWEHRPYLGLGPSAHSFDGRRRWWNVRSVKGYIEKLLGKADGTPDVLSQKKMPVEGSELLTGDQLRMEALMLGLRTRRGVALEHVLTFPHASATLQRLQADGLLIVFNNRVTPTRQGMLLADSLALRFVE